MKKITLNETDLIKIVKKIINEQSLEQSEIETLNNIFVRELKPLFMRGNEVVANGGKYYQYYNRERTTIGLWCSDDQSFYLIKGPDYEDMRTKICETLDLPKIGRLWWRFTKQHLINWLSIQLRVTISDIYLV